MMKLGKSLIYLLGNLRLRNKYFLGGKTWSLNIFLTCRALAFSSAQTDTMCLRKVDFHSSHYLVEIDISTCHVRAIQYVGKKIKVMLLITP
jgi:hypothetical protein